MNEDILAEVRFNSTDLHTTFIKNNSKIRYLKREREKKMHDLKMVTEILTRVGCTDIEMENYGVTLGWREGELYLVDGDEDVPVEFCYKSLCKAYPYLHTFMEDCIKDLAP